MQTKEDTGTSGGRRWAVSGLLIFGGLLLLVAFIYAEEDIRGRVEWGRFKSKWEAKGEKFRYSAVAPPAVADEDNFAMAPVVASCYLHVLDAKGHLVMGRNNEGRDNRLSMPLDINGQGPSLGGNWQKGTFSNLEPWQRYYRNLSARTNLFPVLRDPQTPAADVLLALSIYDSNIDDLRKAAELPESRFPLPYDTDEPYSILLPHLAAIKRCAVILQMRALAELESGQPDRAAADVELALKLTDKIRTEPTVISQLVRIAMTSITVQPVWEGLAKHRWTDGQLAQLEKELGRFDYVADYQMGMRAEVAAHSTAIEYLRRHPEKLPDFADSSQRPEAAQLAWRLVPSGWYYQNVLCAARVTFEDFLPVADTAHGTFSPAAARKAAADVRNLPRSFSTILARMVLPALEGCARRFALGQATADLGRTGCALERYRLAHGRYPDSLDDVASFLSGGVPHDVINGGPLHYRLTDDGQFTLYSIGWNEKDDGGTVVLAKGGAPDPEQGDWVWRYPQ